MSQFLRNKDDYTSEFAESLDIDRAVKLSSGGSTCDIYRARWQRREVFVKRLKEEFRAKPLYLDALDKEFDIGVGLQHPSLPRYLEFHRDYIVMDYIDGATLADMIKQRDPWLKAEKHVLRLLGELVDVVDYLHRHNVVHCDIKPDNIMITSNNKNLVLVDFDKSYTDALNDTSGHPSKYGLPVDEVGKTTIDFRGIGLVAEKLHAAGFKFGKYKEFVKACYGPEANCEKLRELLSANRAKQISGRLVLLAGMAVLGFCFMAVVVGIYIGNRDKQKEVAPVDVAEMAIVDTLASVSTERVENRRLPDRLVADKESKAVTQEEVHLQAKRQAEQLDKRILPYFDKLQRELDRLAMLKSNESLTGQQLLDSIRAHADRADEQIAEAFAILNEMFPGLTDREAWRVMSYSKAYTGYSRRIAVEGKAYREEYERRFAREGNSPH